MDLDDLRKRAAQHAGTNNYWAGKTLAVIDLLRQETDEYDQLITRQGELLTGVANALKGEPAPLSMHDWSDLPAVARTTKEAADAAWWMLLSDPSYCAGAVDALAKLGYEITPRSSVPDSHSEGNASDNEQGQTKGNS